MTTNQESLAALLESGWSLYHQGKHQAALKDLRQALALSSESSVTHYRLGFCHRALDQSKEALYHFREAARLEPENPWTSYQIGKELALRRRLREALPELAKTIQRHPLFPDAYHDAASCLANLGSFESAALCYSMCALLCDVAGGEGVYTAVTTALLKSSSDQLKTLLGLKRYAAIQERLLATLGLRDEPKPGDIITRTAVEAVAHEIVSIIGQIQK